jgi:hypothetical protein
MIKQKTKTLLSLFTSGMLCAGAGSLSANIVIIEDDFSSLPLDVELEDRSTWWGPSWNSGDLAYTIVSLDGPDGVPAITKTTEVFAGRFYGGGLRNGLAAMPDFGGADVAPEDVRVTFWLKGTTTQDRGQVGFSILSFDTSGGSNVETGAAYYLVPIVPAEWTEISITMDQMQAGIPGNPTAGNAFDFTSDSFQIFFWTRNEHEMGWPIQENENHKWSFSVAALSVVAEVASQGTTWAGFPVVAGWADTGDLMGLVQVEHAPWIYSADLASYVYMPEAAMDAGGMWMFKPNAQEPQ